jgi:hypothetical protein
MRFKQRLLQLNDQTSPERVVEHRIAGPIFEIGENDRVSVVSPGAAEDRSAAPAANQRSGCAARPIGFQRFKMPVETGRSAPAGSVHGGPRPFPQN